MSAQQTTPEQQAALAAYWAAETPEQHRAACAAIVASGLPDPSKLQEIEADLQRMRGIIEKAAAQFDFYAEQHRAKGTPDADKKAEVNVEMAAMCRAGLRTPA